MKTYQVTITIKTSRPSGYLRHFTVQAMNERDACFTACARYGLTSGVRSGARAVEVAS